MKNRSATIVFFGSGPVAAKSLGFLAKHFSIEAVITKPRPPHHKGDVPVFNLAQKLKIHTITVKNKAELHETVIHHDFKSRIGVLVDFAVIVQAETINLFPKGIVNGHFSLLPEWRGPDPITYTVLSGQEYSGTSLMLLAPGVDTGDILSQAKIEIPFDITQPQLTDLLIKLNNGEMIMTIPKYLKGKLTPLTQDEATLSPLKTPTYSKKITKEDGIIDWSKPAQQIEREIRAFIEWPGSRTTLFDKDVIVTQASKLSQNGTIADIKIDRQLGTIIVHCSDGSLSIQKLKPAGKREMTSKDFISGYIKNRP